MRKITKAMLNAFMNGDNVNLSNTCVNDGNVYLHGNKIVSRVIENGEPQNKIAISFCGWTTPTTADRINAIVDECTNGRVKVGIKGGEPELRYRDGKNVPFDSTTTVFIETLPL